MHETYPAAENGRREGEWQSARSRPDGTNCPGRWCGAEAVGVFAGTPPADSTREQLDRRHTGVGCTRRARAAGSELLLLRGAACVCVCLLLLGAAAAARAGRRDGQGGSARPRGATVGRPAGAGQTTLPKSARESRWSLELFGETRWWIRCREAGRQCQRRQQGSLCTGQREWTATPKL